MAHYKSKIVFGLCLATRTHIWHFYDALLYIVQFSGNVFGTGISVMIRFVRDRFVVFAVTAEYHNSIFRSAMSTLLFMLIIPAALSDFYRLSHSRCYVKLLFGFFITVSG